MANRLIKNGDLYLYGVVGASEGEFVGLKGFTDLDVIDALTELDGPIAVHLNSPGGFTSDGIAIYNALAAWPDDVSVSVDAEAASAGSVIAMAGSEIIMREGSQMMIHNAAMLTIGDQRDHRLSVDQLVRLDESIAKIYAKRTGMDLADVKQLMMDETWMSAAEAVKNGFATKQDRKKATRPTAFDYRKYQHPPERLVAMAVAWERDGMFAAAETEPAETPATTSHERNSDMATEKGGSETPVTIPRSDHDAAVAAAKTEAQAAGAKAASDRIATIMASDKLKGREKSAIDLALKSPSMSAEDVIAFVEGNIPAPTAPKLPTLADRQANRPELDGNDPHALLDKPTMRADIVADMKRRHGIAA